MLNDLSAPATKRLVSRIFDGSTEIMYVLSTRVESSLLREFVSVFLVRADAPHEGSDPNDYRAHDGSVDLPVLRLCVPTTRR